MADFSVGIVGLDALGSALTRRLDDQGIGNTVTDSKRVSCRRISPAAAAHRPARPTILRRSAI